jgi:hypothetical protein
LSQVSFGVWRHPTGAGTSPSRYTIDGIRRLVGRELRNSLKTARTLSLWCAGPGGKKASIKRAARPLQRQRQDEGRGNLPALTILTVFDFGFDLGDIGSEKAVED